jgi:steroid delta-isomerase-like uncharacterized protein
MTELQDLLKTHYDAVNAGDLDAALMAFDPAVKTETPNGPLNGIAEFRAMGEAFRTAAPDNRLRALNSYETGDTLIVEGVYSGTHTGPLAGPAGTIPATGKAFSFPYVDILRARNGRFVTHHMYWDNVTFLSQLGLLPS